ncbi:MAG TPA: UDP-glucuronic acid decarboxylase family protein [Planctomycetota bacterium]
MRVLVTGGAGFLGSHLCDALLARGDSVLCMDNLLTGSEKNLAGFRDHPRFRFTRHDVTKPIEVGTPLDAVLHFASPASPADYLAHPIHTLKVGALGTHHALGVAKARGARFLLASTSEVYGDPLVSPQTEEYWGHVNPIGPRGVYDEAKRFAEAMTMAYRREHAVATSIVRIFNTYGPRMRANDGRVVCGFICQALKGDPLTIFGDGSQTRSFCFVSDLVDGLLRLLDSGQAGPINIGNPDEIPVLQLAREVLELTGSKSKIETRPLPQDDPRQRRPDITKARTLLKWEPQVSRLDGLRRTIDYFRGLA